MQDLVSDFLDELKSFRWFSEVGRPSTFDLATKPSLSWQESFTWCEHPVSRWCKIEGSLILHRALAKNHYERFRSWNEIARSIHPKADSLMADVVIPSVPAIEMPEPAKAWIRSQIISAALEMSFSDCYDVRFFRDQIGIYRAGHFPCGWQVSGPDAFPTESAVVVF
jgi:hypothetical protein